MACPSIPCIHRRRRTGASRPSGAAALLVRSFLAIAALAGGAGCGTVEYPPGAPEIISGFMSRAGVDGGRRRSAHRGIDIKGHYGQEILAAADGVVLDAVVDACWGPTIAVDHGDWDGDGRIVALYGHVGEMLVREGERVARGQVIARLEANEHEFACISGVPHLHFQLGRQHRASKPEGVWGWGYFLEDGGRFHNPNLLWADGPFKVTCFEPGREYKAGRLTYPVPCG